MAETRVTGEFIGQAFEVIEIDSDEEQDSASASVTDFGTSLVKSSTFSIDDGYFRHSKTWNVGDGKQVEDPWTTLPSDKKIGKFEGK